MQSNSALHLYNSYNSDKCGLYIYSYNIEKNDNIL